MNLEEMRNRVHRGMADRARSIPVPDIDAALNAVWQFQLPEIVQSLFREHVFTLTLRDGVDTYVIAEEEQLALVRALGKDFYHEDSSHITFYDNPAYFHQRFNPDDDETSTKVTGVLYYGKELVFRPIPEVPPSQIIKIPGTAYQDAIDAALGITNANYAYAVVRGAVRDMAADLGYEGIAQRYGALFDQSVTRMRGGAQARPPAPRRRADF